MRKLIFLVGISGSGKTTFIKNELLDNYSNSVIASRDELRNVLAAFKKSIVGYYSDTVNFSFREKFINVMMQHLIRFAAQRSMDIIIDATNLNVSYIKTIIKEVESNADDYIIEYIVMNKSFDLQHCRKSVELRDGLINEELDYIDKQYKNFMYINETYLSEQENVTYV